MSKLVNFRNRASLCVAFVWAVDTAGCSNPPAQATTPSLLSDVADVAVVASRTKNRNRGRNRSRTANTRVLGNSEDQSDPLPRGPMLPEDLGPGPEQRMDLAQGTSAQARHLSTEQISSAMQPLLSRLLSCAEHTTDAQGNHPRGRVGLRIRIRNDGHPVAATVQNSSQAAGFVDCIRRVVATARFDSFDGSDIFVNWGFTIED